MKLPKLGGNWGLKLLALAIAIVLYHTLKNESSENGRLADHDRKLFTTR